MTRVFYWVAVGCYTGAFVSFFAGAASRRRAFSHFGVGLAMIGLGAYSAFVVQRFFSLGEVPMGEFLRRFPGSTPLETVLYIGTLLLAAGFLASLYFFRRAVPTVCLAFGAALSGELALLDYLGFGRMPIATTFEYLSFLAFWSGVALLAVHFWLRQSLVSGAVALTAVLVMAFASLYSSKPETQLVPALQSYWLQIHVTVTIVAEAAFAVAFVSGILLLIKASESGAKPGGADGAGRVHYAGASPGASPSGQAIRAAAAGGVSIVLGTLATLLLTRLSLFDPRSGGPLGPVRTVLSFVGSTGAIASLLYYPCFRLATRRQTDTPLGGLLYALVALSLFVSAEICGGLLKSTEERLAALDKELSTLGRFVEGLERASGRPGEPGQFLTAELLAEHLRKCERGRELVLAARRTLRLPLRPEDVAASAAVRAAYEDLRAALGAVGTEIRLPLYYKDLRAIELSLSDRIATLRTVASRLDLPASYEQLMKYLAGIEQARQAVEANALLPRHQATRLSVFTGLAFLLAVPIFALAMVLALRFRPLLPRVETLDRLGYEAVAFGYPLFAFGALIAGAVWAHFAWGQWWSWDPKEVGSLVVWLLYTIYLHERLRRRLEPSSAAVYATAGFLACVLSLVGNFVLGGLHSYG